MEVMRQGSREPAAQLVRSELGAGRKTGVSAGKFCPKPGAFPFLNTGSKGIGDFEYSTAYSPSSFVCLSSQTFTVQIEIDM